MLTRLRRWLGLSSNSKQPASNKLAGAKQLQAKIIPRGEHCISRKRISSNACKVMYRLRQHSFQAYLVGGCVRDLLLNHQPKDFDVATNARPEQVRKIFNNCRLIGRRFRLAHVYFGQEIVEVATFRATSIAQIEPTAKAASTSHPAVNLPATAATMPAGSEHRYKKLLQTNQAGMLIRDNIYGNIEQDVIRRDFTINALYYNIDDFTVVDYVNGLEDIAKKQIRMIGDPEVRFREDPVRMLRAVRFANKLDFIMHPQTAAPIAAMANLLANVAPGRLFEEYLKLFLTGHSSKNFVTLTQYGLLQLMFPELNITSAMVEMFTAINDEFSRYQSAERNFNELQAHEKLTVNLIKQALLDTDERIRIGKSVAPGFLLAVLLWEPLQREYSALLASSKHQTGHENTDIAYRTASHHEHIQSQYNHQTALLEAASKILAKQARVMAIPRYFSSMIKDIWLLQLKFKQHTAAAVKKILPQDKFRASYDFLLLRAKAGDESVQSLAIWWQEFLAADTEQRAVMLATLPPSKGKAKARKKFRRKPKDILSH